MKKRLFLALILILWATPLWELSEDQDPIEGGPLYGWLVQPGPLQGMPELRPEPSLTYTGSVPETSLEIQIPPLVPPKPVREQPRIVETISIPPIRPEEPPIVYPPPRTPIPPVFYPPCQAQASGCN